jgi:TRAP-type mannitol/chloroaromatic compound transport system substrate-binding protein
MRIPGLGGDVLARAGGSPVTLPGGEVFTALQTGAIDAAEWVGPYNDMIMGLQDAARFYYYPGWQEPGPTLECIVNKDAWAKLPTDLQAIVELAASALNDQMTAEFSARNAEYLAELEKENKVQLREFPREVLATLRSYMDEIVAELVASDPEIAKIHASYSTYKQKAARWSAISEQAYLNSRDA